jgi:membrane associated rhomboid family serine protease
MNEKKSLFRLFIGTNLGYYYCEAKFTAIYIVSIALLLVLTPWFCPKANSCLAGYLLQILL